MEDLHVAYGRPSSPAGFQDKVCWLLEMDTGVCPVLNARLHLLLCASKLRGEQNFFFCFAAWLMCMLEN